MTALAFPQDSDDFDAAFNNARHRGDFNDDPTSPKFWAHHDYLASEFEGEVIAWDWFLARPYNKFLRISRKDES